MNLINVRAEYLLQCMNRIPVLVIAVLCCLWSCQSNHEKIEVWKYIEGGVEKEFIDTINKDMSYKNRFLVDIHFLDSIMFEHNDLTKIKSKKLSNDLLLEVSDQQVFVLDSKAYTLIRGDLIRTDSNNKFVFIYDIKIGVIALYSYGFGLVKLVSKSEGNRINHIKQELYVQIDTSRIFFPILSMPELVEIEIFNQEDSL